MSEISAEKLIKAVKSRPALYNKADASYHSHNKYKGKIWKEVCRDVYSNWDQLRPAQKVEYGFELQKRWKSLRTCFTRELALQRKSLHKSDVSEPDENPVKKRKKYEHFDAMSFLLNPEETELVETGRVESEGESSDPLDSEIKIENFLYQDKSDGIPIPVDRNEETYPALYERSYETQSRTVEEKILDLLKDKKKEEDDDDRQFMLSLVPGFKKLNDKQKYEAKIEILKVLKRISFQDDNSVVN